MCGSPAQRIIHDGPEPTSSTSEAGYTTAAAPLAQVTMNLLTDRREESIHGLLGPDASDLAWLYASECFKHSRRKGSQFLDAVAPGLDDHNTKSSLSKILLMLDVPVGSDECLETCCDGAPNQFSVLHPLPAQIGNMHDVVIRNLPLPRARHGLVKQHAHRTRSRWRVRGLQPLGHGKRLEMPPGKRPDCRPQPSSRRDSVRARVCLRTRACPRGSQGRYARCGWFQYVSQVTSTWRAKHHCKLVLSHCVPDG